MKQREGLFRRSTKATSTLQWIEECMSTESWWIHVQSSSEMLPVAPTPPATPSAQRIDEEIKVGSSSFNPMALFSPRGFELADIVSPRPEDRVLHCAPADQAQDRPQRRGAVGQRCAQDQSHGSDARSIPSRMCKITMRRIRRMSSASSAGAPPQPAAATNLRSATTNSSSPRRRRPVLPLLRQRCTGSPYPARRDSSVGAATATAAVARVRRRRRRPRCTRSSRPSVLESLFLEPDVCW
ncbi:hypothetical protein PVAP13_8KG098284 [Panicum virgatum]|nr:hypothetical protein PVAP13_8KG098284 [Panicum virgatum]